MKAPSAASALRSRASSPSPPSARPPSNLHHEFVFFYLEKRRRKRAGIIARGELHHAEVQCLQSWHAPRRRGLKELVYIYCFGLVIGFRNVNQPPARRIEDIFQVHETLRHDD